MVYMYLSPLLREFSKDGGPQKLERCPYQHVKMCIRLDIIRALERTEMIKQYCALYGMYAG